LRPPNKGRERKGEERRGKERKGEERRGKERKGEERRGFIGTDRTARSVSNPSIHRRARRAQHNMSPRLCSGP
jgi:hypothetical protein